MARRQSPPQPGKDLNEQRLGENRAEDARAGVGPYCSRERRSRRCDMGWEDPGASFSFSFSVGPFFSPFPIVARRGRQNQARPPAKLLMYQVIHDDTGGSADDDVSAGRLAG